MELMTSKSGILYVQIGDSRLALSNSTKTDAGWKYFCFTYPDKSSMNSSIIRVDLSGTPRNSYLNAYVKRKLRSCIKPCLDNNGILLESQIDTLKSNLNKTSIDPDYKKRKKKRKKKNNIIQIWSDRLHKYVKIDLHSGDVIGKKKSPYKNIRKTRKNDRAVHILSDYEKNNM